MIETVSNHLDAVTCLIVSPDGKTLFSASKDKSIKLWELD
ncbi:MAG: WD40 repeat domain-containing protein [Cyanobacteria bacterium P01_A01_bin.84]